MAKASQRAAVIVSRLFPGETRQKHTEFSVSSLAHSPWEEPAAPPAASSKPRWEGPAHRRPQHACNHESWAAHSQVADELVLDGARLSAHPEAPLPARVIFSPWNFNEKYPLSPTPSIKNYPKAPVTVPPKKDRNGEEGAKKSRRTPHTSFREPTGPGLVWPSLWVPRAPRACAPEP